MIILPISPYYGHMIAKDLSKKTDRFSFALSGLEKLVNFFSDAVTFLKATKGARTCPENKFSGHEASRKNINLRGGLFSQSICLHISFKPVCNILLKVPKEELIVIDMVSALG